MIKNIQLMYPLDPFQDENFILEPQRLKLKRVLHIICA